MWADMMADPDLTAMVAEMQAGRQEGLLSTLAAGHMLGAVLAVE